MLTLYYEGERARIHDNGIVDYAFDNAGLMIVTTAPSKTLVRMVEVELESLERGQSCLV